MEPNMTNKGNQSTLFEFQAFLEGITPVCAYMHVLSSVDTLFLEM